METVLQDLRYALRALARQPAFTAIAVFTLAVGIGANTAIYSVLDATILRPLPYRDPGRLMAVSLTTPGLFGGPPSDDMVWSYPKYETFARGQQVFESTALYHARTANLVGSGDPERLRAEVVNASYFPLLGAQAALGRLFLPGEDSAPEKDFVAVISDGLWRRRFGSHPKVAGATLRLDQRNYVVVGVLPAGFQGLTGPADVWLPLHYLPAADLKRPQSHSWSLIGRLKSGVTIERAKGEVKVLGARIDRELPMRNFPGWGAKARTLDETRIEPGLRRSVVVLFGAVCCVLLIACVNVANLLLARGAGRTREIAIRLAIGAGRWRLVRQLLTESLALALLGGAASVAVAYAGVKALSLINPGAEPSLVFGHRLSGLTVLGLGSIQIDWRTLLFAFGCALASGAAFGLAPAIHGTRAQLAGTIKGSAKFAGTGGVRALSGRSLLLVAEIALAVVLLTGAGLMIKSFGRLSAIRSGVDPANVLTVRLALPFSERNPESFFDPLEARVAALPGVISAAMADTSPMSGEGSTTLIRFLDRPPAPPGSDPVVGINCVSPGYLKTMKVALLRGRWLTPADHQTAPKVAVVNETASRRFWPGEDPIGKRIGLGQHGFGNGAEVIGVVADVRYGKPDEPLKPDSYLALAQSPMPERILFVRTAGDPRALIPAVRREIRTLNATVPAYDIKTMEDRVRTATSKMRFSAILLGVFAGIALALAAVGIYGVMACLVSQRTREIGIRVALGARPGDVLRLVIRRGAGLAAAGIAAGLAGALAVTGVLTSLLYEVKPHDAPTYALIAGLTLAVTLLASYIPARRALAVDPSLSLRSE